MTRRLLNLATALSLLLCAATALLWVRGTTTHDALTFGFGRGRLTLASGSGGFETSVRFHPPVSLEPLRYQRYPPGTFGFGRAADLMEATTAPYTHWTRWGFMAAWCRMGAWSWYVLSVPAWAVMLAASCLPARRLPWGRRRRRDAGYVPCRQCGYDLRATPGRCPECGEGADGMPA